VSQQVANIERPRFSNPPGLGGGGWSADDSRITENPYFSTSRSRSGVNVALSAVTRATIGSFAVGEPVAAPNGHAGRPIRLLEFRACCRSVSSLRELHAYWSGPVLGAPQRVSRVPITGWPGGALGAAPWNRPFRLFVGELSSSFTTYQGTLG